MEKIYMNNNQKQQKTTFQQVFKRQLSKQLSVIMVFVAFLSFLLIGVTNVSYAAPEQITDDMLGDSFTTAAPVKRATGIGGADVFPVFMYSTTTGVPIFCLERDVDYLDGTTMTKQEKVTDDGLLYVMANTFPHKDFYPVDENGNAKVDPFPDEVQTWITQAAIWQYLYETNAENNTSNSGGTTSNVENIAKVFRLEYGDDSSVTGYCDINGCYDSQGEATNTTTFYQQYIQPLVTEARQANVSVNGKMVMSIANNEISVTSDEKYYQTAKVTVSNTNPDQLVPGSVNVSIASAPDGTILVDQEGKELGETTTATEFYVRIPVDAVTEDKKTVELSATGTFRGYEGYYYRNTEAGAQTVSTVVTTDVPNSFGLSIPINYTPDVPDTNMSIAQSVYFIGLVVLLCGLGIIYANAKPRQKQQ